MSTTTITPEGQKVIDTATSLIRLYHQFKAGGISRAQYIRQVREVSGR